MNEVHAKQPGKSDESLSPAPVSSTVWTSSTVSVALAGIVLLELVALTSFGYYRVQETLEPHNLADRVESALRENYPDVRRELITEIKASAPQLAAQASSELRATAPEAREWLERATRRQIERGLDEVTELSEEQFRAILSKNHESIASAFEKVEAAPEESRELVLETEASIEQELGVDLQRQARNALALQHDLNAKLALLTDPDAKLTAREQLERRIVRILKTMQQQELQPSGETRVSQTR